MNEETSLVKAPQFGAMTSIESQRAIAETQSAILMARANPRDQIRAIELIKADCARPTLAEHALYEYARGGQDITGPSIRLAEALALRWGNLAYGTRELERSGTDSTMQAFAWDLEANVRREMVFTVPHVRESRNKGAVALTESRDIYEATANMGARRVRACILGLIPGDVVDEAVRQVESTLNTKAEVTPERITKMLELFAGYGVKKEQIEKRIQRRIDTLTPALMLQLGKIANSLRDGMSSPADWFEDVTATTSSKAEIATAADVMNAASERGWAPARVLAFIQQTFGKDLPSLERGEECQKAVAAILAYSEEVPRKEQLESIPPASGTAPAAPSLLDAATSPSPVTGKKK